MKSILIIEDDPKWKCKLDEILFQFNYSNLHFCSALEVELFLKKEIPELIIVDLKMGENHIFEILNKEPKHGADNKLIFFLHPKSTNGVLVELCQERIS